jgi:CBS domain containing-hemolysin-like protein
MTSNLRRRPSAPGWPHSCWAAACLGAWLLLPPARAHASIFEGETLDAVANALSWVVLVVVPIVAIAVFWLLHIMPEKIAERRHHPQAEAIKTLCLLSLFFGGLLWPLAWLWAYSKPVLYKLAYGADTVVHEKAGKHEKAGEPGKPGKNTPAGDATAAEIKRLRERLAELEGARAAQPSAPLANEGTVG